MPSKRSTLCVMLLARVVSATDPDAKLIASELGGEQSWGRRQDDWKIQGSQGVPSEGTEIRAATKTHLLP